ncbi:CopG family transcriptional regulator [Candidatus Gottesmanbacteria bacterium RBG_16_37_8]|uniref:CopG family transcriptional regulator n=1 Tax=Candidatus Gottesmanbacteria bacterium RBG_16_37_8 TaxID=1798371 RepID=A0A1F5YQM8_9BACT|nr:MAG: CopG family transcriptional regulator [Candidatus Gottesmanbacteria bacterium RBG_16_37_8]
MKNKIKYKDEPINMKVIRDFLPRPEDLVIKEKQVKVTLNLSKKSVDFFKNIASKQNVAYQSMIRKLIDFYTAKHD